MKNKEILYALKQKRKIAAFAQFVGLSVQGVYKVLDDERPHKAQYMNYILFLRHLFEN